MLASRANISEIYLADLRSKYTQHKARSIFWFNCCGAESNKEKEELTDKPQMLIQLVEHVECFIHRLKDPLERGVSVGKQDKFSLCF